MNNIEKIFYIYKMAMQAGLPGERIAMTVENIAIKAINDISENRPSQDLGHKLFSVDELRERFEDLSDDEWINLVPEINDRFFHDMMRRNRDQQINQITKMPKRGVLIKVHLWPDTPLNRARAWAAASKVVHGGKK